MGLLRCPRTGDVLNESGGYLTSTPTGTRYPIVGNLPVLVDFEQSVLSPECAVEVRSPIERNAYVGVRAAFKRLVSPPNKVTLKNVDTLIGELELGSGQKRVLVVGGGSVGHGMRAIYEHPRIDVIGFDIYGSPQVQFVADAHKIPLVDNCCDAVVVQAVLEHVLEPSIVVSEIHRVLKEHGLVYAETPFLQHVHEGAYDFTRFTESGHRYLFRSFDRLSSGATSGAGTQLLWSIDYFARCLFRSRLAGKAAKIALFWLQYFDRVIPSAYNIDAACGVYFLGQKSRTTCDAKDAVRHYQGSQ